MFLPRIRRISLEYNFSFQSDWLTIWCTLENLCYSYFTSLGVPFLPLKRQVFSLFYSGALIHFVFFFFAVSSLLWADFCDARRSFGFLPPFQLIFLFCRETYHSRFVVVFLDSEVEISRRIWISRYFYFRDWMDVYANVLVRGRWGRFRRRIWTHVVQALSIEC